MKRDGKHLTFYETITEAVRDMSEHGYDSEERLKYWMFEIAEAAKRDMTPPHELQAAVERMLRGSYARLIDKAQILKHHPGVSRFTLEKVKPKLRAELDRRILASSQLIRLNREEAIQKTLRRFSGWATSIPVGGSDAVDKPDVKRDIRKALAQLPFEERRVIIDQGYKFVSALNETIAKDGGAIALIWHSHWRRQNYNYRKDHKERDGKVYTIRGNWAQKNGLMKPGDAGYYDDVTSVGEEIFCSCFAQYLYALRDLPKEMLTKDGEEELARVRALIEAM